LRSAAANSYLFESFSGCTLNSHHISLHQLALFRWRVANDREVCLA
jgi:hypothetical protein